MNQENRAIDYPDQLASAVELFTKNIDFYRTSEANETTTRTQFINPLLESLGWDVANKFGKNPLEREVIEELSMKVNGVPRAPDYGFLIKGQRKWFLEAKKPSVRVETGNAAAEAAFQLRRYAWSAGLSVGVVTNFAEFSVYNTRQMPAEGDSASVGRIRYFTIDELSSNWKFLAELLSRESVANGSIEAFSNDSANSRGTRTVDLEFLSEIKDWRLELARDIASRNEFLVQENLSLAVQRLIDRIIFLRFAEARGLEHFGELQQLISADQIYQRLWSVFNRADDKYNSGLFHKSEISPNDEVTTSSPKLKIGDEVLRQIIGKLYFPYPYEFSVIPSDVLGSVYEQFLGDEIQLSDKREVSVEQKVEVRKAGGVYYTPPAVVDFIIGETVKPLLEGKTPDAVSNLRFLDPASGSGSFLISLFQELITWHEHYYISKPSLAKKYMERGADGSPRLKTSERKKILVNNIYGVDLDPQAVEVTKLSLLLKVLENQAQLEFAVGQVLPNLGENIICGNTLIDEGLAVNNDAALFRPLPKNEFFPEVFSKGGFDAVVGNPPYLNVDTVWGEKDPRLQHLKTRYPHIHTDKTDLLFYFIARSVEICRGEIGLIVSRSFLEADKAQKLRGWLANQVRVRKIIDMRHTLVFPRVGINTAMVFLTQSKAPKTAQFLRHKNHDLPMGYSSQYFTEEDQFESLTVDQFQLSSVNWNFGSKSITSVLEKIDKAGTPLGQLFTVGKGMETGANKAFTFSTEDGALKAELVKNGFLKQRARNSDIKAFSIEKSGSWMLLPYGVEEFDELPSAVRNHLFNFKEQLEKRAAFKRGDCEWWRYSFPLHLDLFDSRKLVSPYMARTNSFAVELKPSHFFSTDTIVLYGGFAEETFHFLTGILNTKLLSARFRFLSKLKGGQQHEYFAKQVARLCVPTPDPSEDFHKLVVSKVSEIRSLQEQEKSTIVNSEKHAAITEIERQKKVIERELSDYLGLTEKETSALTEVLD